MRNMRKTLAVLAAGISWIAVETPMAMAQATDAPEATSSDEGTIVVTARRRSENISKVPTTVSAISGEGLAERSISSQADLQASVPGLLVRETQSNNNLNYAIRGQTVDAFSGSSTAVVPYVNEVPVVAGGVASFFDLDSIQVVKGPQGTLFGRNATGGAVLSTTVRPKSELGGYLKAGYGNFDAVAVEGAVDLPISPEMALFRVAFKIARRDRYIKNLYTGPVFNNIDTRELGKVHSDAFRGSLLLNPGGSIENLTVVQYERTQGNNSGTRIFSFNTCGSQGADGTFLACGAHFLFGPQLDANIAFPGAWAAVLAANPGYDPTGIQGVLARQNKLGFWEVNDGMPSFHDGKDWFVTNTTTIELGEDTKLKNIFGYTHSVAIDSTGQTGTPYLLISNFDVNRPGNGALRNFANEVTNQSISEELQLQGKAFGGGLEYVVGAYYQQIKNHTIFPQSYFSLNPVIPPASTTSNFKLTDTSKAIFAHGTFDLGVLAGVEGLKFSMGGRYAWEDISVQHQPGGTFFGLTTPPAKFDRASWNLGLEYQVNPNLMVYVVARESWRAGGINGVAPPALSATLTNTDKFKLEIAQDFEAGIKFNGDIGGRRAHLFLAAYTMRVKDIQRALFPTNPVTPALGSIAITVNVPEARIKGLEFDAGVALADWLEIGANAAHTDASFTKNVATPFGVPTRFGPVADTPSWTGSAFAVVTLPVSESMGTVKLRGDVYSQSSFYFSNTEGSITPGTKLPGYTTANFRLDWDKVAGSQAGIGFWIKNAFNERYYVGGLPLGGSLGVNSANVGRPRMFGFDAKVAF